MSAKPLRIVAIATAKQGKGSELKKELEKIVDPSRKDPGCIEYIMHDNNKDSDKFVVLEQWESAKLLEEHLATPHLKNFVESTKEILDNLELIELTAWD